MKERTITLACGALCALVFVSALFTPGQARGAVLDKPADVTAHPVQVVDPTPTLTAAPISSAPPYSGLRDLPGGGRGRLLRPVPPSCGRRHPEPDGG